MTLLLAVAVALPATPSSAQSVLARVLVPAHQTLPEQTLTTMLVEEAHRRTPDHPLARVEHAPLTTLDPGQQVVVLAARDEIPQLLPPLLAARWHNAFAALHPTRQPEGFSVLELPWSAGRVILLAGNDPRGELFAAGWLLRQMRCTPAPGSDTCTPLLPTHLSLFTAPDKPVRGHQIGYRNKNNTYDAWNLAQFEQQIRDLAIFGGNTLQLIAPVSDDDRTSVLYPAPPLETVLGISALLHKYGLACDLYYPELRTDYTQPAQVAAELHDFEALVQAMPQLDALYIPGGDPGHTPPAALFPLVEREAAILHRYHPNATVWISAQGFDRARYQAFYALLDQHPAWLTGVFFGPQSRDSFSTQRRRIPARYPLQFYPDIAHTMHAQFPVPQWDPIWALTEGREPICPRPLAFAAIYRHYQRLNTGFITYSEGVNDDVNKILFNQLGWSPSTPIRSILSDYARWFLGRQGPQNTLAVDAILGLESDWTGPIASNTSIARTRSLLDQLQTHSTPLQTAANGRWQSLLYRSTYDDYVQRKLLRQRAAESAALAALATSAAPGTPAALATPAALGTPAAPADSSTRVANARRALTDTAPSPLEQSEHDQLFTLAHSLFTDWGLQLSVPLYHAENWERGANLDRVDTPLTDAAWLQHALDLALQQPTEPARLAALHAIVAWQQPVPGALYDDLGDPAHEPHLLRGTPWIDDPELYTAAIDGIADRTLAANPSPANPSPSAPTAAAPWRLSWLTYAETLYEFPLTLRYTRLDPHRHYHLRVTYAGEDYALPLRLTANSTLELHPPRLRHSNPETLELDLPPAATSTGTLTLQWTGPSGSGGSGRGRQVAEVWLLPQP